MIDDPQWTRRARQVPHFRCDPLFAVGAFAAGPPPPALPAVAERMIAGSVALGREDELIQYYRSLLAEAAGLGRMAELQNPFPHFRIKPAIIEDDTVLTWLPWYDSAAEAESVFTALTAALPSPPDEFRALLDDQDQGWHLRAVVADAAVYWREADAEQPTETGEELVLSFDAAILVRECRLALDRLGTIHGRLVAGLGRDWWNVGR